jgi:tetratricopeptide (TPR) repeat protein
VLSCEDLHVLKVPLTREVQRHLPVPASVRFYCGHEPIDTVSPADLAIPNESRDRVLPAEYSSVDPLFANGQCLASLSLASGLPAKVVVHDVDPLLLRKISSAWWRQVRATLPERLEEIRLGYVDPETDLYNRRAAEAYLQDPDATGTGFFLMINTVFPRRSAGGNLQKIKEVAVLLPALTRSSCFSFGYGVFGVFLETGDREKALQTARYLQHRLKREGMRKVHIGCAQLACFEDDGCLNILEKCWQSLGKAEKRGPFGIGDPDGDITLRTVPFQLAHKDLFDTLKGQWRGLAGFTLAVFSGPSEIIGDDFIAENNLMEVVKPLGIWCGASGNGALLLFPEAPWATIYRCIDTVHEMCREKYGDGVVAIGIASWPCLDFAKKDIPGNCLKALAHGSLLSPGSVVVFDHLSLNVSGDLYFEEGDYRNAIREYRRGLLLKPGDINLNNSLGVALAETNQGRPAADCFLEVLRQDPDNYMALVNLGYVHLSRRQKEAALACFERARKRMPRDDTTGQELYLSLGRLYSELGRHGQAVTVLEQWQDLPGSEKEYLLFRLLGQGYGETGHPEKAIVACQRALQLFPRDSISLSMLGVLYVEQGEGSDVGLSLCNRALIQDPFNEDHWCRLGRALLHTGNYVDALAAVKRGLRIRRNHVEGHLLLGAILCAQRRYRQAKKYFLRVMNMKGATEQQMVRARAYCAQLPDFSESSR